MTSRLKKIPYLANILNHPRMIFAGGIGLFCLILNLLFTGFRPVTDLVIAWNVGAITYLFLYLHMIFTGTNHIKTRAKHYDENEWVILLISGLAVIVSIAAIIGELAEADKMTGFYKLLHIGMAVVTLFISWVFIHVVFTLHYAHEYYSRSDYLNKPSIIFPDTKEPNYTDFLYFSFVIGTSGQTADVAFGNSKSRRIGLLHCVVAYLFNATILALMINTASSLIGNN